MNTTMENRKVNRQNVVTRIIGLLLLLCAAGSYAQTDVTGYETVSVSIPASAYNANEGGTGLGAPQMARVKYNKTFPLVITSDDMGKTELTNNWAEVNGYPNINDSVDLGIQPGGTDFLAMPYKKYYMQHKSNSLSAYTPMTYTDNVGKTQRYRMTSAIMPFELKSDGTASYDKIDANDAKLMLRTGWSFAQHDVDDISSVEAISAAMTANNTQWATKVGVGLKVMVEPNGNHNYLAAGKANSGICWNIFQNSTNEYPFQSRALNDWAATRSSWATPNDPSTEATTFTNKPDGGYARTFFQGNESAWMSTVNSADGSNIVIGGTHGLGDEIKDHLRTANNVTANAWVGSADEVWEYYHIYNNLKIENVDFSGGNLTFDVQVPTYLKNQYRELTLNIPGLTGGGTPTFSTASGKTVPVTGGSQQTSTSGIGYTMNIGLETSITDHIDQLMAIYRDDQTNLFVKRDLEYLISQLWDGSTYTTQLNATAKHDLTIQSSLGTTLATIKTDTDGDKSFAVPRYIVSSDKLYEVSANGSRPNYAQTITTTTTPSAVSYSEKSLSSLAVSGNNFTPTAVLVVEGEDMTGMTVLGADLDLAQTSHGRYWAMALGSGGMAGNLVSGTTATVTSALPRGKYKAVIGYGETYKSQGTYTYNLLVDGTQAASVSSSSATNNAVTELTTAEFEVSTDGQAITLTTDNTNTGSRWIDYIYFVQTGTLEPQPPTAAIAASAGTTASIKTGNSITITANATQHGGSDYTGIKIYQCDDNTGAVSGDALATSDTETVSYTFTPGSADTYYFKAVANDATLSDGTSEVITVTVVDNIDTYTLNIIDKSGNVAMTTTVASGSLTTDPLPNAYRSPFATDYKYYNTIAEAQANSGTNLTETSEWIQSTVYVGYDVKTDEFNANKKFAIYNVNNKYMHATLRLSQSHVYDNLWWLQDQNYDTSTGTSGISATTLAFVDNSYMWNLGDDPYNVKIQGIGSKRYVNQETYNTTTYGRMEHLATSADGATKFCIVYYGGNTTAGYYALYNRTHEKYVYYNGDGSGGWRLDPQRDAGKLKITELPSLNINVIDDSGNTECTLHGYYKSGAAMPSFTPFFLTRTYTSNQRFYYDAACTDAITADGSTAVDADKIAASNYNVYMKYDLDENWNSDNLFKVSNNTTQYWYAIRFCNLNTYLNAGTSDEHNIGSAGSNAETSTTANNSHWALFGSPYALKLVNRDSNNEGLFAAASMALTGSSAATAKMQTESNEFATVWEMRDINNTNIKNTDYRTKPALNPFGSFSGEAPFFFLYANSTSLNPTDNQNCRILQYDYRDSCTVAATLALSSTSNTTYVDQQVTLTATATPDGEKSVTYFAIEQETATDTWTVVGTAYNGTNAEGATKDENGVVTLTYPFTPSAEGLFNFRAKAIVDGNDASPLYSTDENQLSQQLTITASIKQLSPKNSTYTLTLIDKDGKELLTETDVPKSRITATNSISNRNGDPLNDDWRSPLVTLYKYYEGTTDGKTSAQAADDENQVDWNTYTGTTVYVGYTVSDAIDLNGKDSNGNYKFSSLNNDANSLMQNRVHRDNNDANPLVRDASKFGKMYMLKFKTSADYNLEDGSDNRNPTPTPENTLIYPYTNGDGPIYMYSHQRYLDQKDNGASTRTRWPWYLVSPKNDPYHVYITSWQSSHTDNTDNTNHYSYLRTYYNSTLGVVVTNNVTDDDRTLEGGSGSQIMPTDYMILNGSGGTDGLNYKLMTSSTITDASTTERRTVTSFEQYWRNNPTAQTASGGTKNSTVVATDNSTLTGYGWHNYKTWVNAAKWDGTKYTINGKNYSKDYQYEDHWYMTVNVGDGSLDIVETNIDGVLVLLDNHGWEIMRQPIVEHDDLDYSTVQAALKKYDSPMVKNYKFYSTRNVDHKVPGYHKYDITYQTSDKTKITGLTLVNSSETITSLADYPEVTSGGALTDLYVTYEVADDYANSYTGAATEEGTSASSFLLQQGSNYAKANSTAIESTSTVANADRWYLRPNFNIDAEMGYLYENGTDGEKNQTDLETLYNTNSSNGFDPYNLQIQNVNSSTYFTTNAKTAALNSGAWTGNGSSLSLAAVSTQITPTGYDNKTLAVTNATFMAVKDSYGNMRLMPRFQHEQVVDNFATLAAPATLSALDYTNTQTTQLATPVTYVIVDNSGNRALKMTVSDGIGISLPDALKSPMVSEYQFHSTYAHAATAATRATGDLTVAQDSVYVSYTVNATKMAATKNYAIIANNSGIYMHANFRVNESHTDGNRFWIQNQQWDVSNGNGTKLNATNLPFIDDNYLWQLGDDPYNIQIKNLKTGRYSEPTSTSSQGNLNTSASASYCLLYWNAETTGSNYALRYREATPSVTPHYVIYSTNNDGDWRLSTTTTEANAKLTLLYDATLPDLNINVQQTGSNNVEATLKMHYVSTAKMSDFSTKLPYFLRRAYTKDAFAFYYDAAGEHAIAANSTFDNTYFDRSNIYLRYTPVDDWNTDNLFRVSTAEQKNWYALLYYHGTEANQQYLYLNTSNNQVRGKTKNSSSATDENFNWALMGSPYALKLINRAATDKVIGLPESTTANTYAQPYTEGTEGIVTDWEMVVISNSNSNSYPSIRPQGSLSQSDRPNFYLAADGDNQSLHNLFGNNTCEVKAYEKPINVTYHIKDNASGQEVDFIVSTIAGSGIGTLPSSLERRGTKNVVLHSESYEGEAIAADATASATLTDIYVTYDINYTDNTDNNQLGVADMFSTTESPKWFTIKNGTQQIYYGGSNLTSVQNNRNSETEADMWAFIGTPYHFEIINRAAGTTLHAATSSTGSGSYVYVTDDTETYPNYIWETVASNTSPWISFRMQGTIYGLTGAQSFNNSHAAISKKDNSTYIDALTITPVSEMTFNIYGPDNTLSASYDIPIATYNEQVFSADGTSDLSKLIRRRYTQVTAISANADFSSPMDSYTVTSASANQTIYVKWDYTDYAPVFSSPESDVRDYQYYIMTVCASGSNYPYIIGVDDDGSGGYDFKIDQNIGSIREHKHQFALVGNPYSFKLYSRYASQYVGTPNQSGLQIGGGAADAVFDMQVPVSEMNITQFVARLKGTVRTVTCTPPDVWIAGANQGFLTLRDIIIPVHVFKEGMTDYANQMDYREYAMDLTSHLSTADRITDSQLTETGNAVGTAHDFRHAFCDYTFYRGYDWSDGELSYPIPDEGLSYYGGKDQYKRQFFATYTVDHDGFDQIYLIKGSDGAGMYIGKDAESTHGYTLKGVNNKTEAKNDDTRSYRWQFTGDPYDLQIVNVGLGETRNSFPLAVKAVSDGTTTESEDDGTLALLTSEIPEDGNDTESYGQYSHWEIIAKSDGNYVFWNIDEGEALRYTKSLSRHYAVGNNGVVHMTADEQEMILELPIERYAVTWHVMENDGTDSYSQVATAQVIVDENATVVIEDMPASLKRHFCKYNQMYSDATCVTAITSNSVTVTAATDVYVPYTLDSGAPDFLSATPTSSTAEKYWYEMGYPEIGKYICYDTTNGVTFQNAVSVSALRDLSNYQYCRWALVGSPYSVKFYNKMTETYLISDGDALTMGAEGTAFTLMDDYSGNLCAIYDAATGTYINASAMLQTANNAGGTAVDFSNTYGVVKIAFVLHYSANTLRQYDSDEDYVLDASAAGTTETIKVDTYQKLDKSLDDVLPKVWKRAFCQYTYDWDTSSTESTPSGTSVSTITNDMVEAYNGNKDAYLYIHVTYDYTTNAPFQWSSNTDDYTGKHWYYLVNNHRPNGILGKMVHRDSDPKLRISTDLVSDQLYLNNYEWCVIGDPYGFRMLNRYDPDQRFDEYISVTDDIDSDTGKPMLKQVAENSNCLFEMMPGQYSYNFWMHPVYTAEQVGMEDEFGNPISEFEYVGQNSNGSAAILMTSTANALRTNSAANFRLERRSDATLQEYYTYEGLVGALTSEAVETNSDMLERLAKGTATDADKTAIHDLVDNPANIVQMKQGYYRLIPYTWEKNNNERRYVRGYLNDDERTGSGMSQNLKVETLANAEYDPASIFWFNATKETGTSYPRYYVRTQGLSLTGNGLGTGEGFECRYEDIGAGIMQLKSQTEANDRHYDYLSCASGDETSTNHCFDEQAGLYKTRFYLQKVGNANSSEMAFKMKMNVGDLRETGDEKLQKLPYTYTSLYVPYDLLLPENCDAEAFIGKTEHYHPAFVATEDNYYNKDEYSLYLHSVDLHQTKQDANENDISARFIPAGTPVVFRSVSGVSDIEFTLPSDAPSEAISGNTLSGTYLKTANTSKQIRIFGRESDENGRTGRVGFFPRQSEDTPLTNNKVYYMQEDHSSESSRKGIFFEFTDDATVGIANVGGRSDDRAYDLQGRRLDPERVQRTGVYIVNGRKVILRK